MNSPVSFASILQTLGEPKPLQTIRQLEGLGKMHLAAHLSQQAPLIWVSSQPEAALQDARFLLGNQHSQNVMMLLTEDKTPYHATSPDPLLSMERLATLHGLALGKDFRLLITTPRALLTQDLPLDALQEHSELLEVGMDIHRESLLKRLYINGYHHVQLVEDPGTYTVRGSILDIFWPGLSQPIRIDFFGDTVESIHTFDPASQRHTGKLSSLYIGPAKNIFLEPKDIELAEQKLRDLADDVEYPTKKLNNQLADLRNGIPFFGIEALLPAFHPSLVSPLELIQKTYSHQKPLIIFEQPEDFKHELRQIHQEWEEHYKAALVRGDLCYAPTAFLLTHEAFEQEQNNYHQIHLLDATASAVATPSNPSLSLPCRSTESLRQDILRETLRTDKGSEPSDTHHLLTPLVKQIKQAKAAGFLVFLPATSGGTHRFRELLMPHGIHLHTLKETPDFTQTETIEALRQLNSGIHAFTFTAQPCIPARGGEFTQLKWLIFSEDDIFGKRTRRESGSGKKKGFSTSLSDLSPDDYVVHVDHGLSQFKGLTKLNVRGVEQDYVLLCFADSDKLYLPVYRINLIQRYSGAEGKEPRLDKLGGPGWQTKKKKVKEAVVAMAQELLHLYARRELAHRKAFPTPTESYYEFEAEFGFETTPDQQKAIDEVLGDMQKTRPMDRLICGDVGYGKTEVAMRASMLAVAGGTQVAILAPTTVLAQQHGITFTERFKNTGAQVAVVSRFQKNSEIKTILQKLQAGHIDVLIGTHRLLSSDVNFKNLGLVIVDEEQRFGIKSKEQLKRLRAQVDFLTLSATPIPRTLQMGFFGIRDLSIIETPPVDRRAIRTSIVRFDDEVIREAILRELSRNGQIYFVHNRVSTIYGTADYLKRLVPEAKIEVGHGQMEEEELENVMVRFMKHEFNVLVCTTIIETGIDVPSANTMFVDDAANFGLSQLYQLRGRIGRSKERAFAYLLIPATQEALTPVARKRLEILHRFSELGAGFKIAQHDLELRGAGDLLGKNQHGHVATVGYDLYADLLKEAVEELRGHAHEEVPDPEVNIPFTASLPDKYCPDLQERLTFYQKLATAYSPDGVWEIVGAMNDLLGEAPEEVICLAEVMLIKQQLRKIAARGIELILPDGQNPLPKVSIALGEQSKLEPHLLATYVKNNAQKVLLSPKMKLVYTPTKPEWETGNLTNLFSLAKSVIKQLEQLLI